MKIECALYLDGVYEGKIESSSSVVIGKKGKVTGEVYADKIIINGELKGMIDARSVEIMSEGRVFGEIVTDEIVIEPKGLFEGESKIRKNRKEVGDSGEDI
ncbi:bactofilin family protein [Nitrosophilus alvini]|uniref:bactofilin family protein n=1 Tax=Nitrosophilus alvini TaxID=2714855 RepID=UPI00190E4833|nr:polymer-forming cytoskeletal protein [Nitrosophilus alvini]